MLLLLIPITWLGVATLVVCLCRMAAMADAAKGPNGPRGTLRAQLLVLEPTSLTAGATRRLRAPTRGTRRATLQPRGLATIHPIR
jgi:hypothetical protein